MFGTREIILVNHTDCRILTFADDDFRRKDSDMERAKLARAVRIGATGGVLAASPEAPAQIIDLLRRAGTLLIVGVPARPGALNLPIIQDWELRVQGCATYTERDVETALRIATEEGIPTREIVAATFALDDVAAAFDRAAKDASGKVFVEAGTTRV